MYFESLEVLEQYPALVGLAIVVIPAVMGALTSIIPKWLESRGNVHKLLIDRIDKLETDLERLQRENVKLRDEVAALRAENAALKDELDDYRREHDNAVVRFSRKADRVARALALREEGLPATEIASRIGVHVSSVYRYFNEVDREEKVA